MTLRVVVADDQALVRSGFRMILDAREDLEVVGEAGDGDEAVALVARLRPDVALVDVRMPRVDGIEATRRIVAAGGPTRVVVLTTFERDDYIVEAIQAGASGFLVKNAPPEELVAGVRAAAAGDALEVLPGVEDHPEARAHERLVVGDEDADHRRSSKGRRARTP